MSAVSWIGETPTPEGDGGLTPGRIDVYLVSPESVTGDDILHALAAVLDQREQSRWRALEFAADRHDFLVSHALLRFALSRHASVPPAAWSFAANQYGRPEIASPAIGNGLRFNLSHTRGLIAVAVGRERDVGIDVENATGELSIEAAESILSPTEIRHLHELPEELGREHLFALWTLKEAYAKARGQGFSLPLSEFSFDFDEPPTEITLASDSGAEPGNWLFEFHRPSAAHCLAVAYEAAKLGKARCASCH